MVAAESSSVGTGAARRLGWGHNGGLVAGAAAAAAAEIMRR